MTYLVRVAWQAAIAQLARCGGEKCDRRRKGSGGVQVPVCRLLGEVFAVCQAVLTMLADRQVRGGLITTLRGKVVALHAALCGVRSWVSSTDRD